MPSSRRSPRGSHLAIALIVTSLFLQTTIALSLSDFQRISGFSTSCTNAYNSQISGCTAQDFNGQAGCSSECIAGLQSEQQLLQSACLGESMRPTKLIERFLDGTGVVAVCPSAILTTIFETTFGGGGETSTTQQASQTTEQTATSTQVVPSTTSIFQSSQAQSTSSVVAQSTTTVATTLVSTTAVESTSTLASSSLSDVSSITASSSSVAAQSTTTSVSSSGTTSSSSSSSASSLSSSSSGSTSGITSLSPSRTTPATSTTATFLKTAVNDGQITIFTSPAEQQNSNNPDAFGGGGSPFEIGVVMSSAQSAIQGVSTLLACVSLGVALMLVY
ncbi:hypothetical protein MMC25_003786 [Agyrium rufum]|nr:hypothetical protein [Agyrium rufum]